MLQNFLVDFSYFLIHCYHFAFSRDEGIRSLSKEERPPLTKSIVELNFTPMCKTTTGFIHIQAKNTPNTYHAGPIRSETLKVPRNLCISKGLRASAFDGVPTTSSPLLPLPPLATFVSIRLQRNSNLGATGSTRACADSDASPAGGVGGDHHQCRARSCVAVVVVLARRRGVDVRKVCSRELQEIVRVEFILRIVHA